MEMHEAVTQPSSEQSLSNSLHAVWSVSLIRLHPPFHQLAGHLAESKTKHIDKSMAPSEGKGRSRGDYVRHNRLDEKSDSAIGE